MAGAFVPALLLAGGTGAALLAVAAANLACALAAQPLRAALDRPRARPRPRLTSLAGPIRMVLRTRRWPGCVVLVRVLGRADVPGDLPRHLPPLGAGLQPRRGRRGAIGGAGRRRGGPRGLGLHRRPLARLAADAGGARGIMAICSAAAAALQAGVPLPLVLALMAAFGASATGWNGVYLAEVARLAPPAGERGHGRVAGHHVLGRGVRADAVRRAVRRVRQLPRRLRRAGAADGVLRVELLRMARPK